MKSFDYVLIDNVEALRAKLTAPRPPLDRYWANYLDLAASDPIGEFQALPPLAWLVTGDEKFGCTARTVFLELCEALPLADASIEAQFHAYPVGAPVARFAVFLDWLWDSGLLSDAERTTLASRMVEVVYTHCCLRLKGRLPAGDNQQSSMAFACAVTGYIFGHKRAHSPAAREMFRVGISRYYSLLQHLGAGGWSGEGSTYHCQVVGPVLALFTAFMEQLTGRNLLNLRLGESSVGETLTTAGSIINGAGLLPGWDEYGNCAPQLKTHLVYLARRTGETWPLEEIVRHGMWSESEILAWYNDDRVWSAVFWPDTQPDLSIPRPPRTWLNPPVAGKLVTADRTVDLLQMWDVMDGGRPSRAHLNPNSIELCSFGTVHTSDGRAVGTDTEYFATPPEVMFSEDDYRAFENAVRFWATQGGENPDHIAPEELRRRVNQAARDGAHGCASSLLDAHSVIVVDREGYRFARTSFTGCGSGLVDLPSLKAVRGDVSEFYRELWGLTALKRSSLLLGDRLVLLHDRIEASAPHRYTWQLMLRPTVQAEGNRARQRLREGTVLDVAAPEGSVFQVTPIDYFARYFEQRTHRLWMEQRFEGNGSFDVIMRPVSGWREVKDISAGWSVAGGGEEIPAELFEHPPVADLSSEYLGPTVAEDTVWFGRVVELDAAAAHQYQRLTVMRAQVDRIEVYVNGVAAPDLFEHPSIEPGCRSVHKPDARFWPTHFSVAGLLKAGSNRIAIASSEFRGQVIAGPVHLLSMEEGPAAPLSICARDVGLEICDGETAWRVVADNECGAELALPEGVVTDAVRVAVSGNVLALAGVRQYRGPLFEMESSAPIDLELNTTGLYMDIGESRDILLRIVTPASLLQLRYNGVMNIEGCMPWPLWLRLPNEAAVFWDGSCADKEISVGRFVPVAPPNAAGSREARLCRYDVAPTGEASDAETRHQHLRASLQSAEWLEVVSAVQAVGRAREAWAIPLLMALFEQEEARDVYPEIKGNWPFSKMKTTFHGWADPGFHEDGKRRFRLKAVILEALGRLGAAEAGELIIRTLQRDADFYPVLVQACIAAGRLRLVDALPVLDRYAVYPEINAQRASLLSAQRIRDEISATEFEARIGAF